MSVEDPRPARRIVNPRAGIAKVTAEGRCRACGVAARGTWLNRMHLVPKGQRGDDVDANIVPGCGSGTLGCHGALTNHHKATWPSQLERVPWQVVAGHLRSNLRPDELEYILAKKGQDWLDRTYPSL